MQLVSGAGHDEEREPMHVMYGTLDAELESLQRTIKRVKLTVSTVSFA